MDEVKMSRERLSALADGHLRADELVETIGQACEDGELRSTWHAYHVIGDVMRSSDHAACSDGAAFLAGFRERLAAEPVVAPIGKEIPVLASRTAPAMEAANEPVFRWKLVAGVASIAAVAAIGWNWVGSGAGAPGPQLAQQVQQQAGPSQSSVLAAAGNEAGSRPLSPTRIVVGNGEPQTMIRDPRLDQLLEAHQQAGGASQMPSGFLRNATFEGASR